MASSNGSAQALFANSSPENLAPLDSVVTDGPSGTYDHATLHRHTNALPLSPSEHEPASAASDAIYVLNTQRAVLQRLKAWDQWDTDRYKSLTKFLMSKAGFPRRPPRPTHAELLSLAKYFFPSRWSLRVVCDFGKGRFERFEVGLENVQQCESLSCSQCNDSMLIFYKTRRRNQIGRLYGGCLFPKIKCAPRD